MSRDFAGRSAGYPSAGWAPMGMGTRCEAYFARTSQRRASAGAPITDGSPQVAFFSNLLKFLHPLVVGIIVKNVIPRLAREDP